MGYVSKDFVHEGCGLPLQPVLVWKSIPYSVQKNIKKAEKNDVRIQKVNGDEEDIRILQSMWYDPEDPNMPNKLNDAQHMFIAYDKHNEPIGATILLPVGNHLFLNNLAGNRKGKDLRVQDFLLWHCVNYFEESRFKYIDVGVSYRPSLYRFFKKWKVWSYPVIFNVPKEKVDIPYYPFTSQNYIRDNSRTFEDTLKYLKEKYKFDSITFVPNIEYAEKIVKDHNSEFTDNSFTFTKNRESSIYVIDLKKIFSVQFGCLIVGLDVNDKDMWNKYGCLDVFKREFALTAIYDELLSIDILIGKRKANYEILRNYFELEDIEPEPLKYAIPDLFYFKHEQNLSYSAKLKEFQIDHIIENSTIGIPLHQNLTLYQLEYLYAVFRGVLNLCSEWEHTDKYDKYKS